MSVKKIKFNDMVNNWGDINNKIIDTEYYWSASSSCALIYLSKEKHQIFGSYRSCIRLQFCCLYAEDVFSMFDKINIGEDLVHLPEHNYESPKNKKMH